MYGKEELCKKLHELYPKIGACDCDLAVDWDTEKSVWKIDFNKDGRQLTHYLEDDDASACLEGKKCIGLGIELGQFL